jgi:hypothetical protein
MAEHQNQFRAGDLAGELQASRYIVVEHVPGDASVKDVADPLIEDQFHRLARIHATHDDGEGILGGRGGANLCR